MRLADLDPRWLLKGGERIGFIFLSPLRGADPKHWRQTCFFAPTPFREQARAVWEAMADQADEDREFGDWQPCSTTAKWTCTPAPAVAEFATLSVQPSLDGSKGGLWHGHITNGQIVGGGV